jgi:hypothetical protein
MIYIGLAIYFLLIIADTWLTLKCISIPGVAEKNKAMRWLVKRPLLLWLTQIIGTASLCLVLWFVYAQIWIVGLSALALCIFLRARIVLRNYNIYRKLVN